MGMYPTQNYGADFVNAMAVTSGMINDRRRLDMEEKRQDEEKQTRDLQRENFRLDNQKKSTELDREKKFNQFMDFSARLKTGQLKPEDYGRALQATDEVMKDTPYLPSDPAQVPEYRKALNSVVAGVQSVRTLPPSNYTYSRDDQIPEVNSVLDGFQTLLSKDRLGKEFVDKDGSVTGNPGATYKTSGVGGFAMVSGEGDKAAFTPLFSISDKEGKPLLDANGRQKLVPSTVGESNDPNAKIRMITPDEMLTKLGFANHALDTAEQLGWFDPAKREQYLAAQALPYLGAKGAEDMVKRGQDRADAQSAGAALRKSIPDMPEDNRALATIAADLLDSGQAKDVPTALTLAKTMKPDRPMVTLKEGEKIGKVDASGQFATVAENPKAQTPPPQHTYQKDGYWITDRWNPQTGSYETIARSKIKEAPDPSVAVDKMTKGQMLKDAHARRSAALSKYNAINSATGSEYVTADGTKQTIASGDLLKAKEELDAANGEVASLGGNQIKYASPSTVKVNSNAKSVRERYEQLKQEDEGKAEDYLKSAVSKGYSPDSIRYIKGELDNKIVTFSTPPSASAPNPQPKTKSAPTGMNRTSSTGPKLASAKTPPASTGFIYQNGKLIPKR